VKEEDYYLDLNSTSQASANLLESSFTGRSARNSNKSFEIIPNKCHQHQHQVHQQQQSSHHNSNTSSSSNNTNNNNSGGGQKRKSAEQDTTNVNDLSECNTNTNKNEKNGSMLTSSVLSYNKPASISSNSSSPSLSTASSLCSSPAHSPQPSKNGGSNETAATSGGLESFNKSDEQNPDGFLQFGNQSIDGKHRDLFGII
jgi:hypothetical protein